MDPVEEFFVAVAKGDVERVRKLLKCSVEVNAKNRRGYTLLHFAAFYGRVEVAELLIKNGADVDAKDDFGFTPLDVAMHEGRVEVVRVIERLRGARLRENKS